MSGGAWSNDQLNQVFVYDPITGTLILRVDSTGLYYYNVTTGSYFLVTSSDTFGAGNVAVRLFPGASSVAGVTWSFPGEIIAAENVLSPTSVSGGLNLISPQIGTKESSSISLFGQTNNSATDNSEIELFGAYFAGSTGNQIGQGTVDEGGNYSSSNFVGTEIAADYCAEDYGTMATRRRYLGRFSGTVQSSSAGDFVGLRLYTSTSKTSLVGATLLADYGQIKIDAANTAQPFTVECGFNGVPGKFLVLGARRASGAGTCFLNINYRLCADTVGSY